MDPDPEKPGPIKKGLLNFSQNSQKNPHVSESLFIKVEDLRPAILLEKRLRHMCFSANFLKNTFSTKYFRGAASVAVKK